MSLVTLPDGRSFQASADQTVLGAALAAGISLPYSCRTGRCSTCRGRVLAGSTCALGTESGLSADERDEGWILTCVRGAASDLSLEIESLGDIVIPAPRTLPCRISSLERVSHDVMLVTLRLPPAAQFDFLPGQYVEIIGPNGIRRSYSLANADFSGKALELHIRAVGGGVMSRYWFDTAKTDDLLRLNGPLGTFFLRESMGLDLIFLATGTGIAPIKALLERVARFPADSRPRSVSVFWGGRRRSDLYFDWRLLPGGFESFPVLSRPEDEWTGARGYVQHVLLARSPDLSNAAVYACGSDAMIRDARESLIAAGLPGRRFYSDAFVASGADQSLG